MAVLLVGLAVAEANGAAALEFCCSAADLPDDTSAFSASFRGAGFVVLLLLSSVLLALGCFSLVLVSVAALVFFFDFVFLEGLVVLAASVDGFLFLFSEAGLSTVAGTGDVETLAATAAAVAKVAAAGDFSRLDLRFLAEDNGEERSIMSLFLWLTAAKESMGG